MQMTRMDTNVLETTTVLQVHQQKPHVQEAHTLMFSELHCCLNEEIVLLALTTTSQDKSDEVHVGKHRHHSSVQQYVHALVLAESGVLKTISACVVKGTSRLISPRVRIMTVIRTVS